MNEYQLAELERLRNELQQIELKKSENYAKYHKLFRSAQIGEDKVRNEIPSSQGRKT